MEKGITDPTKVCKNCITGCCRSGLLATAEVVVTNSQRDTGMGGMGGMGCMGGWHILTLRIVLCHY